MAPCGALIKLTLARSLTVRPAPSSQAIFKTDSHFSLAMVRDGTGNFADLCLLGVNSSRFADGCPSGTNRPLSSLNRERDGGVSALFLHDEPGAETNFPQGLEAAKTLT